MSVARTVFDRVSMTLTASLLPAATYRRCLDSSHASAVAWRPTVMLCVTRPEATSTRVTVPDAAMPRASVRTAPARGSQHCLTARSPAFGCAPPTLDTYATVPSDEITAANGATPSGMLRSCAPVSASTTASASFAVSGMTATRRPSLPARGATAGAPAMKSPSAPDERSGATLSPAASAAKKLSCAVAFARAIGREPGRRDSVTPRGSRPTELTSARPVTGSIVTPCTPERPLKRPRATTRLSDHERWYAEPGMTAHSVDGDENATPVTRSPNTDWTPAGVTRWSVAMTPGSSDVSPRILCERGEREGRRGHERAHDTDADGCCRHWCCGSRHGLLLSIRICAAIRRANK